MSASDARRALADDGWREIGVGDWSWVYADPSDEYAARVTPFDPAYRLHADACLNGPPNRYLPRVDRILPLKRDGYVVIMERLWPADEGKAAALCKAIGIVNDTGYAPPPETVAAAEDDDLAALRPRLRLLLAEGAQRFKLWGGSDIRPGNVMADAGGRLKLVDPVFVKGKAIVEAIAAGDRNALSDFSREQLEDFLTIPPFKPGPETEALKAKVATFGR
jgi:hypothetical protein